MQSKGLSQREL